jgi:hypothetical protein
LQTLPDITVDDGALSALHELCEDSFFIVPGQRSLWTQGFSFLHQGKLFEFMACIFPVLEHSIRRIFVAVNNCAEQLLTAAADT